MKKQITLFRTVLLATVMLWGVMGGAKAQTNLITNPGFEAAASTFLVDGTESPTPILNQLRRISSTTGTYTSSTYPAPASPAPSGVSVVNGLWLKKTAFFTGIYCQRATTAQANSTTYSMLMKVNGSITTAGIDWTTFAMQQRLSLDNTKKYTFTFYANTSASTGNPTYTAFIADKNGVTVANVTSKTITPSTKSSTKYTVTFDLPSAIAGNAALDFSTAYVGVGLNPTYTAPPSPATESSALYLDELSLSESTTPVISSTTATTTDQNPIPISITFNNPVTGFTSSDLVVSNGTVSSFSGSLASYTANVTPTSQGAVTVNITAGAATDGLSNATLAATQFSRIYTAYYRSVASGNWGTASTWQSSVDNTNWVAATSAPTSAAASVTIQNAHTVSLDANASISSITLNTGSIFNVNAGKQLTVSTSMTNNGTVNLLSDVNGTATILTPATIGGSGGTANVNQFIAGGRNWYISSPVTGANATTVLSTSTATTKPSSFVWYDETKGSANPTTPWTPETSTLAVGKGYIAVNDVNNPSSDGTITFNGALNAGSITASLLRTTGQTKEGFNLIGNPYASYVDLSAFTQTSDTVSLETSYWFRTKNSGGTAFVFDTYNLKVPGSSISLSGKPLTGIIAPMQAFWVRVKNGFSSGSLTFQNSKRRHIDNASNILRAPLNKNMTQPILRLQVSNGVNIDETVLYCDSNASNGYDDYDSQKFSNNLVTIPEIYTLADGNKVAINGMKSIPANQEIPLGFTPGSATAFSINTLEFSNFDAGTSVLLKDYATGTINDITTGTPFTFVANNSVPAANRFAIVFKSSSVATGIANTDNNNGTIRVHSNAQHEIIIDCPDKVSAQATFSVYNALGQKLANGAILQQTNKVNRVFTTGTYFVKVKNGNNMITNKMLIN